MVAGPSKDKLLNEIIALKSALYDSATTLPSYSSCFENLKQMTQNHFLGVVYLQIADLERIEAVVGFQRYEDMLRAAVSSMIQYNENQCGGQLMLTQRGVFNDEYCLFVPYELLARDPLESLETIAGDILKALRTTMNGFVKQGLSLHAGHSLLHYNPFVRFERSVHHGIADAAGLAGKQEETDRVLHEMELRRILAQGRLKTLFHPIVQFDTLECVAYEALIRGPEGTPYQAPDRLFSFATQCGLGWDLDRLCKKTAIRSAAGKPKGTHLFINTLPSTLDDPVFLEDGAEKMLAEFGMKPEEVVWELTERHAIQDFEDFAFLMKRYTDKGYKIAIDDVGTGYSSIQTITHVRPVYLKVDITLVSRVHENLLKQELVSSLLSLANNIHAVLIAEGVETREDMETMKRLGVQFGQGFLFGFPAAEFPQRIKLP